MGKARLETLGVLACAAIMSVAAFSVIKDAASALYLGIFKGVWNVLQGLKGLSVCDCVCSVCVLLRCVPVCVTKHTCMQQQSTSSMHGASGHYIPHL